MALRRFTDNPPATTPLDGTETIPAIQDGTDVQVSVDDILTAASGAVTSVNDQTGAVVLDLADLDDVDDSTPNDGDVLTWNDSNEEWEPQPASGGGGGQVDSVAAGEGVDVDASDPESPEVSLDATTLAALAAADSALQPGDAATELTVSSQRLLGRSAPGTGAVAEIEIGANLTLSMGVLSAAGGGSADWGDIGGDLSDQADLQSALDAKADTSSLADIATSGDVDDLTGFPGGTSNFLRADGAFAPPPSGGSVAAEDVSFDNTASGLSADDVQAAIDELAQASGGIPDAPIDGNTYGRRDGEWEQISAGSEELDIITEASSFTADPATHAGLSRYIRAGGDVTFDDSEGFAAGQVFNIRATAALELVEDGVTLTPTYGGTLELESGMAVTVVMTSPTTADVIGLTVQSS